MGGYTRVKGESATSCDVVATSGCRTISGSEIHRGVTGRSCREIHREGGGAVGFVDGDIVDAQFGQQCRIIVHNSADTRKVRDRCPIGIA